MSEPRLKIGVIGAGRMGALHARVLGKHPGYELVGVADTNQWRAQIAAWRAGTMPYRDHNDLLGKVDALVIAVPTEFHFDVGMAALEAGKHVLIEKPIAATVEQAKALLAKSEEKKVQLQVGHVERFNPAVLGAIPHIREPRFITVERLGPYDPRVAGIGVVLDLMIHDLDILLTLVGSEVESLEALGASLFAKHEDIANVRVRFKNGCVADLTASRISIKRCRKIRIFQESSYISLDYLNASLNIYKRKKPEIKSLKDVEIITPKLDKTEPLRVELDHFRDCIVHDRKPWTSGEHGLEALALALQIAEELERYELSHHTRQSAFLPAWAGSIKRLAGAVGRAVRGPEE
ncbi:MAG: Gfo/Idh/MocA family oxidoreductase [Elusimicrobia bacterium]|nr:Gfo/Idh/MocA family oxidoreductase [Elusimicrobiota bacterium]